MGLNIISVLTGIVINVIMYKQIHTMKKECRSNILLHYPIRKNNELLFYNCFTAMEVLNDIYWLYSGRTLIASYPTWERIGSRFFLLTPWNSSNTPPPPTHLQVFRIQIPGVYIIPQSVYYSVSSILCNVCAYTICQLL